MIQKSTPSFSAPRTSPHKKRKPLVVLLSVVALVVAAGAALAYWTADGSGTGDATTGAGGSSVDVVQTSDVSNLRPGGTPQELSGTFTNAGDSTAYVGTVTVSIASVDKDAGAPAGDCDASDYTLTHAAMVINAEVPVGTDQGTWGTTAPEIATIEFNNKSTNQDGCKGATVNLAYVVS